MAANDPGLLWAPRDRLRDAREDIARATVNRLPSRARLLHAFGVWDQGAVPCCVACAVTTAMEMLDARRGSAIRLSPLFNYYVSRPRPGTLAAVAIADGLSTARDCGVAPLIHHAVELTRDGAFREPSAAAFERASEFRLRTPGSGPVPAPAYFDEPEPRSLDSWKRPLAAGCPFVLGFALGPAYERLRESGESVLRGVDDDQDGHAVVVFGYDDNAFGPGDGAFRVKDSRGPRVGKHGTWWIPYSLIERGVARELWIVTDVEYDV